MLQCWAEYADQRPSFKQLKDLLTNIYDGLKHNSEYMQQQYEVVSAWPMRPTLMREYDKWCIHEVGLGLVGTLSRREQYTTVTRV